MIRVVVCQRPDQPDCWYINEISDIGVATGKICYKSIRDATSAAKQLHPYVKIEVE